MPWDMGRFAQLSLTEKCGAKSIGVSLHTLKGRFVGVIAAFSQVERVFASSVKALGPLDLDVTDGEFLSLVGPSGCGKSTALRVIAGLIAPSAGTVSWPQGKPRIGFVFQDA